MKIKLVFFIVVAFISTSKVANATTGGVLNGTYRNGLGNQEDGNGGTLECQFKVTVTYQNPDYKNMSTLQLHKIKGCPQVLPTNIYLECGPTSDPNFWCRVPADVPFASQIRCDLGSDVVSLQKILSPGNFALRCYGVKFGELGEVEGMVFYQPGTVLPD